MNFLVALPTTARHAQEAACAFNEVEALEAFLTTFAFDRSGWVGRVLAALPAQVGRRLLSELERRAITELPGKCVETRPLLEILRTGASRLGLGARTVDRIWDHLSKDFTRAAARRMQRDSVDAIYACEYTALEAFHEADRLGKAKILDFPSLNSRQFETLQRKQKIANPELRGTYDGYFEARFERRQARRDAEMALADVIITNSSVNRQSHIKGGADPEKIFAVPLGAPAPRISFPSRPDPDHPLNVIWAGTFSIRKGAHHFVSAWQTMNPTSAIANVYGAVTLPGTFWKPIPPGMTFHGSVTQPVLFSAFQNADVLVFPTLSDGFGMVVTEAFSCGLPVITTDQAGASDLVEHGRNGLVIKADDPAAIADALRWCLDNRTELACMRDVALDTARGWQWSHYRRALRRAVGQGLRQAGHLSDLVGP